MIVGCGLAFGNDGNTNAVVGLSKFFMTEISLNGLSGDIPETVFFMLQMAFAIITSALIVGAFAERMKFSTVLWFSTFWLVLVYVPICHWVCGRDWLSDFSLMDFAGGTVVHVNASVAAMGAAMDAG